MAFLNLLPGPQGKLCFKRCRGFSAAAGGIIVTTGTIVLYAGVVSVAAAVVLMILLAAQKTGLKRRIQARLRELFDLLRADI